MEKYVIVEGEKYDYFSEDRWHTYYKNARGETNMEPKLVVGKFDENLFTSLELEHLDEVERGKAAIAIFTARKKNKNIPKEWIEFAEGICG